MRITEAGSAADMMLRACLGIDAWLHHVLRGLESSLYPPQVT